MERNRAHTIFSKDSSHDKSLNDYWYELEKDALDKDYIQDAIENTTVEDVASLERRFDKRYVNESNTVAFYYLLSVVVLVSAGMLWAVIMYKNVNHSSEKFSLKFSQHAEEPIGENNTWSAENRQEEYTPILASKKPILRAKAVPKSKHTYSTFLPKVKRKRLRSIPEKLAQYKLQHPIRTYNYRYIRNYKVLNLAAKNSEGITNFTFGTPANDNFTVKQSTAININYYRKIERALYFLKKGNFERSIHLFTALEHVFPKDQNILFYKGLGHYYNSDYGYALSEWNQLKNIEESIFSEEASWYKALALVHLNELSRAKKELSFIASQEGFYKQKAVAKLSEID